MIEKSDLPYLSDQRAACENRSDTFRDLHQRKNKQGIFHLRSLTEHHGRRVDTLCLWSNADCMRLRMHLSEIRQHKGSPQCPRMGRKEHTNATRSRCQFQSTILLNPFCWQFGDAAVLPAWSHNIHFITLGSSITTFSIPIRGLHGVLRPST